METSREPLIQKSGTRPVSLLPRHWSWLAEQAHSTNITLCRLIDEAQRDRDGRYATEAARERCYFLMRDLAGDRHGFEEACRALYADEVARFAAIVAGWPENVRRQIEPAADQVWPTPNGVSENA